MDDETYSILSSACWKDGNIPAAAEWLRSQLAANITGHKTMRTKDLFALWGVKPEQSRTVTNALYKIRQSGLVDDCFRRDATKRHMGHSLVLWQRPLPKPEVSEEDF